MYIHIGHLVKYIIVIVLTYECDQQCGLRKYVKVNECKNNVITSYQI